MEVERHPGGVLADRQAVCTQPEENTQKAPDPNRFWGQVFFISVERRILSVKLQFLLSIRLTK